MEGDFVIVKSKSPVKDQKMDFVMHVMHQKIL